MMGGRDFSTTYAVRYPLVSAGMAMVAGPALVAAVCNAGGLGILGGGPMPPERLRRLILDTRALTQGPFGVNLIIETTRLGPATTEAHVAICAEEHVSPIVFFWNQPPSAWIARLRAAGSRIWMTVSSVDDALRAHQEGFDALIVQASEAGGHVRASHGMFTLLPAVRARLEHAVLIAAGGIADGKTAAAALLLGADALCVGTRLLASEESDAHDRYKRAVLDARAQDTLITRAFGPEWPDAPMRVIRNRAVSDAEAGVAAQTQPIGTTSVFGQSYELPDRSAILPTRATTGDFSRMCFAAGMSVELIRDIAPAGELVRRIMRDATRSLRRASESIAHLERSAE